MCKIDGECNLVQEVSDASSALPSPLMAVMTFATQHGGSRPGTARCCRTYTEIFPGTHQNPGTDSYVRRSACHTSATRSAKEHQWWTLSDVESPGAARGPCCSRGRYMRPSPPSAPNLLYRLRLIKTLAEEPLARSLSTLRIYILHTQSSKTIQNGGHRNAQVGSFSGHFSRQIAPALWFMTFDTANSTPRQTMNDTHRARRWRAGFLAVKSAGRTNGCVEILLWERWWLGLVPPLGDGKRGRLGRASVQCCSSAVLLAAELCASRNPGGKMDAGLRTGDCTSKSW